MPNPNLPETIPAGSSSHLSHHEAMHAAYNRPAPVNVQAGTAYTLAITDAQSAVELTSSSTVTVTVPHATAVNFPIGTLILVYRQGTGGVIVSPATGVTIESTPGQTGARSLTSRYSEASLRKRAANIWVLAGDLV